MSSRWSRNKGSNTPVNWLAQLQFVKDELFPPSENDDVKADDSNAALTLLEAKIRALPSVVDGASPEPVTPTKEVRLILETVQHLQQYQTALTEAWDALYKVTGLKDEAQQQKIQTAFQAKQLELIQKLITLVTNEQTTKPVKADIKSACATIKQESPIGFFDNLRAALISSDSDNGQTALQQATQQLNKGHKGNRAKAAKKFSHLKSKIRPTTNDEHQNPYQPITAENAIQEMLNKIQQHERISHLVAWKNQFKAGLEQIASWSTAPDNKLTTEIQQSCHAVIQGLTQNIKSLQAPDASLLDDDVYAPVTEKTQELLQELIETLHGSLRLISKLQTQPVSSPNQDFFNQAVAQVKIHIQNLTSSLLTIYFTKAVPIEIDLIRQQQDKIESAAQALEHLHKLQDQIKQWERTPPSEESPLAPIEIASKEAKSDSDHEFKLSITDAIHAVQKAHQQQFHLCASSSQAEQRHHNLMLAEYQRFLQNTGKQVDDLIGLLQQYPFKDTLSEITTAVKTLISDAPDSTRNITTRIATSIKNRKNQTNASATNDPSQEIQTWHDLREFIQLLPLDEAVKDTSCQQLAAYISQLAAAQQSDANIRKSVTIAKPLQQLRALHRSHIALKNLHPCAATFTELDKEILDSVKQLLSLLHEQAQLKSDESEQKIPADQDADNQVSQHKSELSQLKKQIASVQRRQQIIATHILDPLATLFKPESTDKKVQTARKRARTKLAKIETQPKHSKKLIRDIGTIMAPFRTALQVNTFTQITSVEFTQRRVQIEENLTSWNTGFLACSQHDAKNAEPKNDETHARLIAIHKNLNATIGTVRSLQYETIDQQTSITTELVDQFESPTASVPKQIVEQLIQAPVATIRELYKLLASDFASDNGSHFSRKLREQINTHIDELWQWLARLPFDSDGQSQIIERTAAIKAWHQNIVEHGNNTELLATLNSELPYQSLLRDLGSLPPQMFNTTPISDSEDGRNLSLTEILSELRTVRDDPSYDCYHQERQSLIEHWLDNPTEDLPSEQVASLQKARTAYCDQARQRISLATPEAAPDVESGEETLSDTDEKNSATAIGLKARVRGYVNSKRRQDRPQDSTTSEAALEQQECALLAHCLTPLQSKIAHLRKHLTGENSSVADEGTKAQPTLSTLRQDFSDACKTVRQLIRINSLIEKVMKFSSPQSAPQRVTSKHLANPQRLIKRLQKQLQELRRQKPPIQYEKPKSKPSSPNPLSDFIIPIENCEETLQQIIDDKVEDPELIQQQEDATELMQQLNALTSAPPQTDLSSLQLSVRNQTLLLKNAYDCKKSSITYLQKSLEALSKSNKQLLSRAQELAHQGHPIQYHKLFSLPSIQTQTLEHLTEAKAQLNKENTYLLTSFNEIKAAARASISERADKKSSPPPSPQQQPLPSPRMNHRPVVIAKSVLRGQQPELKAPQPNNANRTDLIETVIAKLHISDHIKLNNQGEISLTNKYDNITAIVTPLQQNSRAQENFLKSVLLTQYASTMLGMASLLQPDDTQSIETVEERIALENSRALRLQQKIDSIIEIVERHNDPDAKGKQEIVALKSKNYQFLVTNSQREWVRPKESNFSGRMSLLIRTKSMNDLAEAIINRFDNIAQERLNVNIFKRLIYALQHLYRQLRHAIQDSASSPLSRYSVYNEVRKTAAGVKEVEEVKEADDENLSLSLSH